MKLRLPGPAGRGFAIAAAALALFFTACAPRATTPGAAPAAGGAPSAQSSASPPVPAATGIQRYPARSSAQLPPIAVPEWPTVIPGYTQLDPATGLHMTGEPVRIDIASYRLKVTGKVPAKSSDPLEEEVRHAGYCDEQWQPKRPASE